MKFLIDPKLVEITAQYLSGFILGDKRITGKLEAYTLKRTDFDKSLAKQLQQQCSPLLSYSLPSSSPLVTKYPTPSLTPSNSILTPLGPLNDNNTIKLLSYLVSTLTLTFPDYTFSGSSSISAFSKVTDYSNLFYNINSLWARPMSKEISGFETMLWNSIKNIINLHNLNNPNELTTVYSYDCDDTGFINNTNIEWSFTYFFLDKVNKKLLLLAVSASQYLPYNYINVNDDINTTDDLSDYELEDDMYNYIENDYNNNNYSPNNKLSYFHNDESPLFANEKDNSDDEDEEMAEFSLPSSALK